MTHLLREPAILFNVYKINWRKTLFSYGMYPPPSPVVASGAVGWRSTKTFARQQRPCFIGNKLAFLLSVVMWSARSGSRRPRPSGVNSRFVGIA